MNTFPKEFPKIAAYKQQADWIHCVKHVVCLEKIDGTNTRIGIPKEAQSAEDIVIGGRTLLEHESNFSQQFLCQMIRNDHTLCERMIAFANTLQADVTFYGETCGASIQACGFIYGKKIHFVLFAATIDDIWCGYSRSICGKLPTLKQIAKRIGFTVAPCLYEGEPNSEHFSSLLDRRSQHSIDCGFQRDNNIHEGLVIWSDPVLMSSYGIPIVAKYKHSSRREYIPKNEENNSVSDFAQRVVLPERMQHAVAHLQEQGRWLENFIDNKEAVIRRVIQDIAREVDEYQNQLSINGKKKVRKAITDVAEKQFLKMKSE